MLPNAPSGHTDLAIQGIFLFIQSHTTVLYVVVFIGIAWAIWRGWRFTIYPMLHPDEPKELPYLFPGRYSSYTTQNTWLLMPSYSSTR